MTHGEEPGPETHQDSAVLTYLEGLLMHRVTGGQGATATQRCQAGQGNQEQGNSKASTPSQGQPNHAPPPPPPQGPDPERMAPHSGLTQHLKKARLLRSEAWTEHESRKRPTPPAELNGQRPGDPEEHAAALNGSSKCKGESTLLASLLQSFSSRLQNVALSQQLVQSLKHHQEQQQQQQDGSSHINKSQQEGEKEAGPCRESATNRLKGLIKKSKAQNQSNSVPYQRRRTSQERQSESPKGLQKNGQSSSTESLSCAQRLKAVANLVNIRSSPAPSPRPSVACSQLALLLSSEAHLQQYSREQALKAQLAGRSASERLAAMATQTQDTKPMTTSDTLSSLHAKNGSAPQMALASSRQSLSGTPPGHGRTGSSPRPLLPFRERRPFERPFASRPSQNCSSLLLQLLNNHNTQHQLNSQGHLRGDFSSTSTRGSPVLSDGGHSTPDSSFPKDSSDAESCSSSCSPIDLSLKSRRVSAPPPISSPSSSSSTSSSPALDRITESLINKWKPDPLPSTVRSKERELESNPEMKPHHKVTLLQLLLDHKNNENVNKSLDNPDLHPVIIPKVSGAPVARQTVVNRCEEIRTLSPQCGLVSKSPLILPALSYGKDTSSASSPYSLYDSSHSQSIPLDLCKNKSFPSEPSATEPAFSASKLLQNLAQSGKACVSSPPPLKTSMPSVQRPPPQEMKLDHSVTLLEKLTAPVQQSPSPRSEGTYVIPSRRPESSQSASEIENLLERRTVLQLLLGNGTSSKDKVGGKRKREAVRGNCQDRQSSHCESLGSVRGNCQDRQSSHCESLGASRSPVKDVRVKTEPRGEHHGTDHDREVKQSQTMMSDSSRSSPLSVPYVRVIKQEPMSPETVPRDGLLSHLLKQPRAVLFSTPDNSQKVSVKEEQQEHPGPTIPKKRKYSMEPKAHPTGSETCVSPDNLDTQMVNNNGGSGACSASGLPGSPEVKGPRSPPVADSPPVKCPVSESPPSDSRGFNVLKQLLLSNNCLRERSQPGGPTGSPKHSYVLNGSRVPQPSGHSAEAAGQSRSPVPLHGPADPRSLNAGFMSHSAPGSPWGIQGTPQSPKPKPAPTGGDEDPSQPDSPRLMRSNPILYYMLQKGNADLLKERERSRTACQVQLKVKEEQSADMKDFEHTLNPRHTGEDQSETQSETPMLNGSLKKCQ
ncbi:LOW QUALITY PROTEIN: nuclear receptor-interacting protein 1-like [Clupea harengus]|uniref:LOW QUALITY PROTEIN: nuclear receptor-interacting protein 1-like n=2 Tax=Clupea harengus TaxID=7950 RepID=A0A8M1KKX6_CLUHA|nr:LOW QUALITY PROTEIN: nuclear receptor-interacting protein 1-like [Clupea harengus]